MYSQRMSANKEGFANEENERKHECFAPSANMLVYRNARSRFFCSNSLRTESGSSSGRFWPTMYTPPHTVATNVTKPRTFTPRPLEDFERPLRGLRQAM